MSALDRFLPHRRLDIAVRARDATGAAARVRARLAATGGRRAAAVHLVLGGPLVRHCLVPASAGLVRTEEQSAWARHQFRGDYGAAVDAWRVALDVDAAGTAFCALLDGGVVDAIGAACVAEGATLASLTPYFARAQAFMARSGASPWRRPAGARWCAALDGETLTCALHDGHTWRHVASLRADEGMPALVAALAVVSAGVPGARAVRRVALFAPAGRLARLASSPEWALELHADPLAWES